MLWSHRPNGPWSEPVMVLDSKKYNSDYWRKYNKTATCDSNLNGIILPSSRTSRISSSSSSSNNNIDDQHQHQQQDDDNDNDNDNFITKQTFIGLWRKCETDELLTIPHGLIATDWKNASTYKPTLDHPLFPFLIGSGAEDPSNVWTTHTSDMRHDDDVAFHVIFHDEQATRCMEGYCGGQGRHAVSLNGEAWKYSSVNAYNRYFLFTNGTKVRANTRARPHIVIAPLATTAAGGRGTAIIRHQHQHQHQHQQPIALSTGIKERDGSGYVYTLVQPLRGYNDDRKL